LGGGSSSGNAEGVSNGKGGEDAKGRGMSGLSGSEPSFLSGARLSYAMFIVCSFDEVGVVVVEVGTELDEGGEDGPGDGEVC